MFNLSPPETFKAKVSIQSVLPSGGWREESFMGEFKRTPESERLTMQGKPFGQLVEEVLVGWDMVDMERKSVPFTPENLAAFLQIPAAVREAAMAYVEANAGAKPKN